MTPTVHVPKTLDNSAITYLAGHDGPCVTVFLPNQRPGSPEGSHRAFIRRALRDFPDLLASLEDLTELESRGGPGLAIFRSPRVLLRYEVPSIRQEKVVVASHFHLTPLLAVASAPREFFVLDVNRKHLRLLHVMDGECRAIALPSGIPPNMEAAGTFAQHSHDLANHSKSGTAQAVHFGKETERDAAGDYQLHFFALADRGLTETLAGKPLILAGVHEELAAYRRIAKYPGILISEIHGNTAFLSLDQVESRAMMAVMVERHLAGERVLQQIGETKDRSRQLTGVREVCEAAAQGRVHQLCVAEGVEVAGVLPSLLAASPTGEEDLVNAAAVLTLRAGGSVFVMPPDRMEYTGPVAAILRY